MNGSIIKIFEEKLENIAKLNQKRELIDSYRTTDSIIIRKKKKLISFCCNDYLGLTQNKDVIKASISATKKYGVGAGASRLVSGNNELYKKLENSIAKYKGEEAACVFGSGFLTNLGIIPVITSSKDLIIYDELSHASTNLGIKLSSAKIIKYRHNDIKEIDLILKNNRNKYKNCFLLTEGVFSMDGDRFCIFFVQRAYNIIVKIY